MGMPMIIGAGVGALSSAAMGKSPFTGALLGGVSGGALGGAGGFGSGFVEGGLAPTLGLGAVAPVAGGYVPAAAATHGIVGTTGEIGSGLLASAGTNSTALTSAAGLNAAAGASSIAPNFGVPSMFDKFGFGNFSGKDYLSAGKTMMDYGNQPNTQNQQIKGNDGGITRSPFDAQSANIDTGTGISNTAPSPLPKQINKSGQIDLKSLLQANPRLVQFAPNLFGGY
jgi:hypothetical protein